MTMYQRHFSLGQEPFSIAPDPRYLFMSERHREALAHLLYGVRSGGGFVLLTGEIGAGKTTVCRAFLEKVPKRVNVAYIFNPALSVDELLRTVCEEFHIPVHARAPGAPTRKDHVDALNEFLLRTHAVGQSSVLVIDEAQRLSVQVLEQLRLLTNLETHERKLLQIVLIGQPELRRMLARPQLEQLAQRVIARYHLGALGEGETARYVAHRMAVAGLAGPLPFDRAALRRIHHHSQGVPRRINLLCDRALLGAFASGVGTVDRKIVDQAAAEVFVDDGEASHRWRRHRPWAHRRGSVFAAGALSGVALLLGGAWLAGLWPGNAPRLAVDDAAKVSPPASVATGAAGRAPSGDTTPFVAAVATTPSSGKAAPPPDAVEALQDRLAAQPQDASAAWQQLASRWGLQAKADDDVCARAAPQGVQCYRADDATLPLLRKLSRPAIVVLRDGDGPPSHVVLTALGERRATLRIGEADFDVPLAALAGLWTGSYATLWRAPPGYRPPSMAAGRRTVSPEWLDEQLSRVSPPLPAAPLPERVRSFQVAQGLPADGLVGPVTLMVLNRAVGIDEPSLAAN